jgi:hypothetical protein
MCAMHIVTHFCSFRHSTKPAEEGALYTRGRRYHTYEYALIPACNCPYSKKTTHITPNHGGNGEIPHAAEKTSFLAIKMQQWQTRR